MKTKRLIERAETHEALARTLQRYVKFRKPANRTAELLGKRIKEAEDTARTLRVVAKEREKLV